MPKITYYEALSSKITTQIFDSGTFRLHTMKPDMMTYRDADGDTIKLEGTHFKYTDRGEVWHGTVTSITMRDGDGHLLQTIKNIDPGHPGTPAQNGHPAIPADPGDSAAIAADIYSDFKNYGTSALTFEFNDDNDRLIGSRKADIMDGGNGTDHLFGGAGNDILTGSSGGDHLTGGGGKDLFYFKPGDGSDVVTDFVDSGKNHDLILVSKNQYAMLEKHQSGHDVILDFGWGDQLIIEHARANQIGENDFQLY